MFKLGREFDLRKAVGWLEGNEDSAYTRHRLEPAQGRAQWAWARPSAYKGVSGSAVGWGSSEGLGDRSCSTAGAWSSLALCFPLTRRLR